jgi:hypothetical protein
MLAAYCTQGHLAQGQLGLRGGLRRDVRCPLLLCQILDGNGSARKSTNRIKTGRVRSGLIRDLPDTTVPLRYLWSPRRD